MELVGGLLGGRRRERDDCGDGRNCLWKRLCVIVGIVSWSDRLYCVGALPKTNEPTFRTLSVSGLILPSFHDALKTVRILNQSVAPAERK